MKFLNRKSLIFLLLLFLTLFSGIFFARNVLGEACQDITDPTKKIECLDSELSRLSSQSKTLSNQIAQFDAQIRLTLLKIAQTEEKIIQLGGRIDQLEGSLTALSTAFSSRAVETYKMARVEDPLLVLVSAPDLTEAVSRFHYLQRIQASDRDLLQKLQVVQTNYKVEKTDQENLQTELAKQKKNLDAQKLSKAALLSQTKNDEVKYQQLLAQAYAEKDALEKAIISGVKVGPIKRGDPIALVGNSGWHQDPNLSCSTGKHLHLEIQRNNSWTDPGPFLQSKTVIDEQNGGGNTSVGSGSWPWPISDTIRLTQHYGSTRFSWIYEYSGYIHTGFDMISTSSDIISAPADGTLYKSSQRCFIKGMVGNIINIAYIDHGGGLISFYLHVQ